MWRLLVIAVFLCTVGSSNAFMKFNQPCAPYRCSAGQTPAPKKDFIFTANGCGTAAIPISARADFTDCCNQHDAMVACPAFQEAQRDACRCVTNDKVDDAIRERLIHFLEANDAPKEELSDAAVDALLEKYKDQETKMFLRLLVKYPEALKIDANKPNFMDNIYKASDNDASANKKKSFGVGIHERDDATTDESVDEHIEL